ncbi:MAG: hypothetical protein RIB58_01060 [Phycisphaerales bacterium]
MSTIPQPYPAAIDWCTDRLANWPNDPTVIGLDAARVAELAALTQAASTALATARQLDEDKKAAFADYNAKAKAMRDYASQSVGIIRGFAKASANPQTVYTAAQIPAPAEPSPAPVPGVPTDFKVGLLQDGSIELSFECENGGEGGVSYEVRRRDGTGQTAPFNFVKNATERKFVDDTIPPGTPVVTYRIVAFRTTGRGDPAVFLVSFGAGNSAEVIAAGSGSGSDAA